MLTRTRTLPAGRPKSPPSWRWAGKLVALAAAASVLVPASAEAAQRTSLPVHPTGKVATTLKISVRPSPATAGRTITLSATVRSSRGVPTGVVAFTTASRHLCKASLSKGSGHCSAKITAAGQVTITGHYGGDAQHTASSSVANLTVNPASTTTTASASPSDITPNSSSLLTAVVTSRDGQPTGTVAFSDGSGTLCSAGLTGGTAACVGNFGAVGTYTVTATYGGDASRNGSSGDTTVTVSQGSSATSVSVNPVTITAGQSTTLSATVSSAVGTPTGSVSFTTGTTTWCTATLSGGAASCSASFASPGSYQITGTYSGDSTHAGSSGAASLTVQKITTSVSVTASPASIAAGTRSIFKAVVSPSSATGTVTFTDSSGTLCSGVSLSSGAAYCEPLFSAAGSFTITATYSGDATHASSSGAAGLTVQASVTSLQVCITVGNNDKESQTSVYLLASFPDGGLGNQGTLTEGSGIYWNDNWTNCVQGQMWTMTLNQPEPLNDIANGTLVIQAPGNSWHGQINAYVNTASGFQQILETEPNMYYNDTGNLDPCSQYIGQSVSQYQFPLTTPGHQILATCGTIY